MDNKLYNSKNYPINRSTKLRKDGVTPKLTRSGTQKGDIHKVYPLKTEQEIHDVITYYENKIETAKTPTQKKIAGRNTVLITVGFNVGISIASLLSLTWKQIIDSNGNYIEDNKGAINGHNTDKINVLKLNAVCKQAINKYIERFSINVKPDDYIFFSTKEVGGHINVQSCSNVLKEAAKACGINRDIGAMSLQKTYAFMKIIEAQNDIAKLADLQKEFGQINFAIVLSYFESDE